LILIAGFTRVIKFFKYANLNIVYYLVLTISLAILWSIELIKERFYIGLIINKLKLNIIVGIILFIFSEIIFFISLFWAFFERAITPNIEIGIIWPSFKLFPISPFILPLLNTIILLISRFLVTISHYFLIINKKLSIIYLSFSILLGLYFTTIQRVEYINLRYRITDRIFGSIFYILTGFHGIHVIIGTFWLIIRFIRLYFNQLNLIVHTGLEISFWYWHFVDIVWLFLFSFLYWWNIN